jgi:molybdopterin synthase catalytic subunit
MFTSLLITKDPIAPKEAPIEGEIGAVVRFFGIVRPTEGKETIKGIDYEAFHEMAEHQFEKIFEEAGARWPIESIALIHRVGFVPAGDPSLYLEVTAGHRGEAFASAQYIIDEMKTRVPIWKRPVAKL